MLRFGATVLVAVVAVDLAALRVLPVRGAAAVVAVLLLLKNSGLLIYLQPKALWLVLVEQREREDLLGLAQTGV